MNFIQPLKSVKRSTYYQARLIKGDAQHEQKKSRVRHVMTPRFLGAPKSCAFEKTLKMCAIDSTPWVGFNWMRSRAKVTCKGHVQGSRVKVNEQGRKITLRELERRCQFVVRLKANKYYQELLYSLSSYINLLNPLNLQGLRDRLLASGRFQTSSP